MHASCYRHTVIFIYFAEGLVMMVAGMIAGRHSSAVETHYHRENTGGRDYHRRNRWNIRTIADELSPKNWELSPMNPMKSIPITIADGKV